MFLEFRASSAASSATATIATSHRDQNANKTEKRDPFAALDAILKAGITLQGGLKKVYNTQKLYPAIHAEIAACKTMAQYRALRTWLSNHSACFNSGDGDKDVEQNEEFVEFRRALRQQLTTVLQSDPQSQQTSPLTFRRYSDPCERRGKQPQGNVSELEPVHRSSLEL